MPPEEDLTAPGFYDDDDEALWMDDVCPNCGVDYDEIDYEYQICHLCHFNNNKPKR